MIMAENRGNSSGSNTNMPTGVRKNTSVSNNSFNYIDPKTMKEIGIVNKGLARFAETLSGNLEKYNKLIIKSSKELVDTRQKLDKDSRELDEQLAEMKKHYFGKNKKVYEDFEKQIEMKKVEMEKEYEDLRISTKKEFIKQSFKNETESKQIKYLDNKFAKGNNLASINNSYWSDLEKLKESALETYGEGRWENNKEYKQALMNLNDKYITDMKDAWKEDFKENHKVLGGVANGIKDTFDRNKEVLRGFLGPLNLIVEPLKDFFGGFGLIFKGIKGSIKGIFGKFTKKNPTANDVLKSGAFGVGSLFIGKKLDELFGKNKEKNTSLSKMTDKIKKGLMSALGIGTTVGGKKSLLAKGVGLGKGFLTKGGGKLASGLGILGGGVLMAKDAIKGSKMAGQDGWSESKVSSAIGGMLGGFDSGFKGAFSNMGKWALMGFGIGNKVVPIVGGLVGGLIGGAVGGILGWIGGAKISKVIDVIGAFIKNLWNNTLKPLIWEIFNIDKFIEIFKSDDSIGKKLGKIIGLSVVTVFGFIPKLLGKAKNVIGALVIKSMTKGKKGLESLGNFGNSVLNAISSAWDKSKSFVSNIFENNHVKDALVNFGTKAMNALSNFMSDPKQSLKDTWNSIKNFSGDVWEGIKESELGNFVSSLFTSLKDGINKFFKENPVGVWVKSSIITPIQKALGTIGDFFSYISDNWDWSSPIDSIKKVFGGFTADKKTGLSNFDIWREAKYAEVEDAIIRTDGSIIKTNPKDTLVALKDVPLSMDKVRAETNKSLNGSLTQIERDGTLEKKLTTIIDVLSQILAKDVSVQLPPQTRNDLDMLMSGGMI